MVYSTQNGTEITVFFRAYFVKSFNFSMNNHQRSIQRPALDAFRGSLHRFNALRGTLVTTSRFSKGAEKAAFEVGVAPITLIDGEHLIDLLMEYKLGVHPTHLTVWQVDPAFFEPTRHLRWPRLP